MSTHAPTFDVRGPSPGIRLVIWSTVGLSIWALGTAAYLQTGKPPFEALYLGLQLFAIHTAELPHVPITLEIARWLAVLFSSYTLFRAAYGLFSDRIQGLRALISSRHVVLVGLGWKARLFLRKYREKGRRVIVVEKDPGNPYLEEARSHGAIVLVGDGAAYETLRRANVARANVLVCLADDATNLKIMAKAAKLVRENRSPDDPLDCHAYLNDLVLHRNLQPIELQPRTTGFRQRSFSAWEVAAPQMLYLGAGSLVRYATPPRLVIVGLEAMGESLLREAVHQWRMRHPEAVEDAPANRLRITVVDPLAKVRVDALKVRDPEIDQFASVEAVDCDETSPLMDTCGFAFDAGGASDVTAIFVCRELEQPSLRIALRLNRRREEAHARFTIVLQVMNNAEIAELFQISNLTVGHVKVFSVMHQTCDPIHLTGVAERIAMTIHSFYLHYKLKEGKQLAKPGERSAMFPWDELADDFKFSNIDQAEHISKFVDALGYQIVRVQSPTAMSFEFSPAEVDQLARMEHRRFQDRQIASNPQTLKTEFDQLSDANKKYTRDSVRIWPRILLLAGFELRRTGRPAAHSKSETS